MSVSSEYTPVASPPPAAVRRQTSATPSRSAGWYARISITGSSSRMERSAGTSTALRHAEDAGDDLLQHRLGGARTQHLLEGRLRRRLGPRSRGARGLLH